MSPTFEASDVKAQHRQPPPRGGDSSLIKGHFSYPDTDKTIGHETVGVVAAIGPSVKGFTVGERVVAEYVPFAPFHFLAYPFPATPSSATNASTADVASFFSANTSRPTVLPWMVVLPSFAPTQQAKFSRSTTSQTSMPLFSNLLHVQLTVWTKSPLSLGHPSLCSELAQRAWYYLKCFVKMVDATSLWLLPRV